MKIKKTASTLFLIAMLCLGATKAKAQVNAQLFYDFGSDREFVTLTLEMFKQDKWGNTYFFIDHDFNYDKLGGGKNVAPGGTYLEIARCLNFWQKSAIKDLSLQVEYNGGITRSYPINHAMLEKALKMVPFNVDAEDMQKEVQNWEYLVHNVASKQDLVDIKQSPKNSQFAQPLFEFSGACSGCGETPYVKLISQLFGDRQMIANATGCSSIYSASIPSTPYTTNAKGQGPAFDNSLFEDFCEFGLGMVLGNKKMKERICHLLEEAKADEHVPAEFVAAADKWMANMNDSEGSKEAAAELKPLIAAGAEKGCPVCTELKTLDHYLVKRSQWIIGGDGASYDIGYGGLDHVLASGEDVNILVLDTEVYSNTGGQSSKSTPLGAIAQFAAQGKRIRKKDLGLMQTTYGYIYVAQIAMGADNAQTLKAIREAEAYPGPSLIIAYAPCINHGLKRKGGMGRSQNEEKLAVDCGYWHLWRFNPLLADEGKNPFTLDSKAPKWEDFRDFLLGEVRYLSVQKAFPKEADELFSQAEKMAKLRYQTYVRKSQEDWSEQI